MWTTDDLKRAVERRNEHLQLAPEVERVILAAERALGRTEEILRREAAKTRLTTLIALLDIDKLPSHVRALYPILPAKKVMATPLPPLPMPAGALDLAALADEAKIAETGLKVREPGAPAKVINLDVAPGKERARSLGGPSR